MLWIKTKTEAEAIGRSETLWTPVVRESPQGGWTAQVPGPQENGQFWGDAIATTLNDAEARYEIAIRHLPLPGAFRQLILALRARIKVRRKNDLDTEELLAEMYHWAAIGSCPVPYNELAQEPGFNVMEAMPYATLEALDLSWAKLGCHALLLLNKTDRAQMVQLWGEPDEHTTANALYHDLWLQSCERIAARRTFQMTALRRKIDDIIKG